VEHQPATTVAAAMLRAAELAVAVDAARGPNPRVGAVVLDAAGAVVGEGYHRGAGTPHAEVVALGRAGRQASGGTVVVTLEPCNHHGRTPPCVDALLAAGVAHVVYAQADPNPAAAGGAARLRAAGVIVDVLPSPDAEGINQAWTFAVAHGRPFVTWKVATTLDGRVAALDGSSRWITSALARADVHSRRACVDAIVVGTGTALADDPSLTVRPLDAGSVRQPLRVVMGHRQLPADAAVLDQAAPTWLADEHDPDAVVRELHRRECRHVLLEGGPTLAAAFWRAGLVDEVIAYVAPVLLGAGVPMVGDLGVATLADAPRLHLVSVRQVGDDVCLTLRPVASAGPVTPSEV
jgi:diaminohydroxyphosphoribosylaminopyrimidine deaminase/5-amino-6-(5-phosphoribosylamino)uracil reductase